MSDTINNNIQLGKEQAYPDRYDPSLLVSIPREQEREDSSGATKRPSIGLDLWTAFEVSWLDSKGKPIVRLAEFTFNASSTYIVESKSFKYYLNSFNQSQFKREEDVIAALQTDLEKASDGPVKIQLASLNQTFKPTTIPGRCVDDADIEIQEYTPNKSLLMMGDREVEDDQLYSHLLKSNCPVTGQPDWASVWIRYSGKEILPEGFLRYIVGFRNHQGFHESCVEQIYEDILSHCSPTDLTVFARYTRRGGLDINPLRSSVECEVPFGRLPRQ